ncbi:MAG: FAS1-like dehydratase domain-containing protein [Candidatus Helarchaeota archaeon]
MQEISLETLNRKIKDGVGQIRPKKVKVRQKTIKKFCEIINETNPIFFDLEAARKAGHDKIPLPESYLLTLIAPISQDFFTTGIGHLLNNVIKGIIHVQSEIEFHAQLYSETPYMLKIRVSDLIPKTGKMGEYFVLNCPHEVVDESDNLLVLDNHVFFLKTKI